MLNHQPKSSFVLPSVADSGIRNVYALTEEEFIPDAIYVATTARGKIPNEDCQGIEGGRHISDGAFHRFCEEYQLIIFDAYSRDYR